MFLSKEEAQTSSTRSTPCIDFERPSMKKFDIHSGRLVHVDVTGAFSTFGNNSSLSLISDEKQAAQSQSQFPQRQKCFQGLCGNLAKVFQKDTDSEIEIALKDHKALAKRCGIELEEKIRPQNIRTSRICLESENLCSSSKEEFEEVVSKTLELWNNPVFGVSRETTLEAHVSKTIPLGRQFYKSYNSVHFQKDVFSTLEVLGQVDSKFIACLCKVKISCIENENNSVENSKCNALMRFLVLIDQHAAHERVRLEDLQSELWVSDKKTQPTARPSMNCYQRNTKDPEDKDKQVRTIKQSRGNSRDSGTHATTSKKVRTETNDSQSCSKNIYARGSKMFPFGISESKSSLHRDDKYSQYLPSENIFREIPCKRLNPPVKISLPDISSKLLKDFVSEFQKIGVKYTVQSETVVEDKLHVNILVHTLPSLFVARKGSDSCITEPIIDENNIKDLIQEHLKCLRETSGVSAIIPSAITKVLHSYACHGAIRFGDILSMSECLTLVHLLSKCNLPFQCAHGRPSIVPLINLDLLETSWQVRTDQPKLSRLHHFKKA